MGVKPNFFIVGAPKCGTTSLTSWLGQHPNVFLPRKEIHFFNTDHMTPWRPAPAEYAALYEGAQSHHTAIGDASVWYLASDRAIPAIREYNPEAKFIACVRNPLEMAYSMYNQNVFVGIEPILDFETAWSAQYERHRGYKLGPGVDPFYLMYGPACLLGSQIQKAMRTAGDRLHVIFLDDLKKDPQKVFDAVLDFLDLPPFSPEFRAENSAQRRRSVLLRRATRGLGLVKRKLGIAGRFGMLSRIDQWNRYRRGWAPSTEMDLRLAEFFEPDIRLLASLTGRDLSHWLDRDAAAGQPDPSVAA